MSPQYAHTSAFAVQPRPSFTKAQKMSQKEDPRYRNLDRVLARAYIELQKQRMQQKKAGVFMPRMDLYDDPNNPVVTAALELPGMKADQLSVRIEHGQLIVEGTRAGPYLHKTSYTPAPSEPTAPALYPVQEIKYGKFRREVKLPEGVTAAHVRSMLAEGMLTISWPRDPSTSAEQLRAAPPALAAVQTLGQRGGDGPRSV
ncbi:HSP20-like chaperone [Trametes elegans]|nr:HSP20-like chaperone [Trametes elegans]